MAATGDPLSPDEHDRVRAVLYLGGMRSEALEDGVQQVRVKLLEQERTRGGLRHRGAWLATVAGRVALDAHRARQHERGLAERIRHRDPPAVSDQGRSAEQRELALVVAQALEGLDMEVRRLVVLRFYADLSVRQIAEQLDVPEGTVKSRLHAAMRSLRQRLRETEVV
ncbi:RNA polymerase sigma factor [Streptomyces ferrugineus]|nr:sigma-70 family RNA polymerase sigma factor [Streptomyces ferrugineus]